MTKVHPKIDYTLEASTKNAIMGDAFDEMYRHRARVYKINFVRGIFLGLGTFLGGTIIVALLVLLLSWLMSIAPENFHDFFQWIVDTLSR